MKQRPSLPCPVQCAGEISFFSGMTEIQSNQPPTLLFPSFLFFLLLSSLSTTLPFSSLSSLSLSLSPSLPPSLPSPPLPSRSSYSTMEMAQPLPSPSSSFTDDNDIIAPFRTTHAQMSPASVEPSPLAPHHATLGSNTKSSSTDSDDPSRGSTATPSLHSTSANDDPTPVRTSTPALSENRNNNTLDPSSSSESSSPLKEEEPSPSISGTTVIPTPSASPADNQTLIDSDRLHTISKDTPYATLEHILTQLKEQPERAITIASVVGGLIVVRYILPRIGWATLFVGVLGMGFGGFIVAFYLLAVPEATRLKRASTVAKFGKHHDQRFEIVDGVPSWSDSHEKVSALLGVRKYCNRVCLQVLITARPLP